MPPTRAAVYEQIKEEDINVPLLLLMLFKAMPSYDSRGGDVDDMESHFGRVLMWILKFVDINPEFSILLPVKNRAREEANKTRLMLLLHVTTILDTMESFSGFENIYLTANEMKSRLVALVIEGFWNECGGESLFTEFWQIENAANHGAYFMTNWRKDASNKLTGIRYTLFVMDTGDGKLTFYLVLPESIAHRMQGQTFNDADHTWYKTEATETTPAKLPLRRAILSKAWKPEINLKRCSDKAVRQYAKWIGGACEISKLFEEYEYSFFPGIYAMTASHVYIKPENEDWFYKVPKSAFEGLDHIAFNDNVGIMFMNNKTFLAFDELMVYIETTEKELKKCGIERVGTIA